MGRPSVPVLQQIAQGWAYTCSSHPLSRGYLVCLSLPSRQNLSQVSLCSKNRFLEILPHQACLDMQVPRETRLNVKPGPTQTTYIILLNSHYYLYVIFKLYNKYMNTFPLYKMRTMQKYRKIQEALFMPSPWKIKKSSLPLLRVRCASFQSFILHTHTRTHACLCAHTHTRMHTCTQRYTYRNNI